MGQWDCNGSRPIVIYTRWGKVGTKNKKKICVGTREVNKGSRPVRRKKKREILGKILRGGGQGRTMSLHKCEELSHTLLPLGSKDYKESHLVPQINKICQRKMFQT